MIFHCRLFNKRFLYHFGISQGNILLYILKQYWPLTMLCSFDMKYFPLKIHAFNSKGNKMSVWEMIFFEEYFYSKILISWFLLSHLQNRKLARFIRSAKFSNAYFSIATFTYFSIAYANFSILKYAKVWLMLTLLLLINQALEVFTSRLLLLQSKEICCRLTNFKALWSYSYHETILLKFMGF